MQNVVEQSDECAQPTLDVELQRISAVSPATIYDGGPGMSAALKGIAHAARSIILDVTTPAGREQIASVAYKIARSKTLLDGMGKTLVDDWKTRAAAVDSERRRAREFLDDLKVEIRRPLTEFEEAEKNRVDMHKTGLRIIEDLIWALPAEGVYYLRDMSGTLRPATLPTVEKNLELLQSNRGRDWQEFEPQATAAIQKAVAIQTLYRDRLVAMAEEKRRAQEQADAEKAEAQRKREAEIAEKARTEERDRIFGIGSAPVSITEAVRNAPCISEAMKPYDPAVVMIAAVERITNDKTMAVRIVGAILAGAIPHCRYER